MPAPIDRFLQTRDSAAGARLPLVRLLPGKALRHANVRDPQDQIFLTDPELLESISTSVFVGLAEDLDLQQRGNLIDLDKRLHAHWATWQQLHSRLVSVRIRFAAVGRTPLRNCRLCNCIRGNLARRQSIGLRSTRFHHANADGFEAIFGTPTAQCCAITEHRTNIREAAPSSWQYGCRISDYRSSRTAIQHQFRSQPSRSPCSTSLVLACSVHLSK